MYHNVFFLHGQIDNNDYDVKEEDSVIGSEIARSSSQERDELCSSRVKPLLIKKKVTLSQKGSRKGENK